MNDLQDKLRQIETMAKTLQLEGEKLGEEIRSFESQIRKINPPFNVTLQIGEAEVIMWDTKTKTLQHQNTKGVCLLSASDVPIRRKAINYFSQFLDEVMESYKEYLSPRKRPAEKAFTTATQSMELAPIEEPIVTPTKDKKVKRRKIKKPSKATRKNDEHLSDDQS